MDHMLVLQNTHPNIVSNIPFKKGFKTEVLLAKTNMAAHNMFALKKNLETFIVPEFTSSYGTFQISLVMILCLNLIS